MALHFQPNMLSYRASVNLSRNYSKLSKSVERLSTGLKLNSSEDGPSEYAMSNILRGDIATLGKALRNTEDGLSVVKMVDSAMQEISNRLIRMKELAEQAATKTYNNSQRLTLNSEFSLMASEIDRIANNTNFASLRLIDGSVSTNNTLNVNGGWYQNDSSRDHESHNHFTRDYGMKIHMGAGNVRIDDYRYISLRNMKTEGIFSEFIPENETDLSGYVSIAKQHNSQIALLQIDSAMVKVNSFRGELGAVENVMLKEYDSINLQKYHLESADSKISDVDIAKEMTDFVTNQVKTQASTSILAQANSLPQMFLKLMA